MVFVLLADGFEETEVIVPVDLLRRGGVDVALVGVNAMSVTSSHNVTMLADMPLADVQLQADDVVFVPGGLGGVNGLLDSEDACALLRRAAQQQLRLAAICAGPTVLSRLGLIDGKQAVCYPGMEHLLPPAISRTDAPVVQDGRIITARAAGAAFHLGYQLLQELRGQAVADEVVQSVYWNGR